jgi:flavorubredoxin
MMPFRNMGKKAMEKVAGFQIDMIAPSHGPVYKNPERILEVYRSWTAGETRNKAIVVYVSMWGSTEKMIKIVVETLLSEGVEVCLYNVANADLGEIAKDLVDARAVVLGVPTVLGGMHPVGLHGANLVKALRPPLKYGVVVSSYGWGGGALKQAAEILGPTKIEVTGTLEINGPPSAEDQQKLIGIAKQLAAKIRE